MQTDMETSGWFTTRCRYFLKEIFMETARTFLLMKMMMMMMKDDEEASIEDEDEDDDGAVGTINVEF